jgi:hypothetical protein
MSPHASEPPGDRPQFVARMPLWGLVLTSVLGLFSLCGTRLHGQDQKAPAVPAEKNPRGQPASQPPLASPRAGGLPGSAFRAVMPDGAVIELVGVCEYPPIGHAWWRPDGSPLGRVPGGESPKNFQRMEWLGAMLREFAIEATLAEGAEVTLVSQNSSNQGSTVTKPTADKKVTQSLRWIVQLDRNSRMTAGVHYAPEPWKRNAQWKHWHTLPGGRRVQSGGTFLWSGTPSSDVILTQPYEKDGNAWMVSTYEFADLPGRDVRILAIGTDKIEHPADHHYETQSTRAPHLLMAQFDKLPLDSIEKFWFQSRPMTPIQFRNISLHPGQKTNFEVHVGEEPVPQIQRLGPPARRRGRGSTKTDGPSLVPQAKRSCRRPNVRSDRVCTTVLLWSSCPV